ncbi:hypothetical protein MMC17_008092 [Xylographa soralifera]|nr:hypothetical protein [Xylographa soralifera]
MYSPLSSPARNTNIEQEETSSMDSLTVNISSVTKQDIFFPSSPPRYGLDDTDREANENLHAEQYVPELTPPKAFQDIASAIDQKADMPNSLTYGSPNSPPHEHSPCRRISTCNSDNRAKRTPLPSPSLLTRDSSVDRCQPLKRKRGVDTFSSSVTNKFFSVCISDQEMLEAEAEKAEWPKAKKAKLHNKKQIVSASGDVEYLAAVCQVHVSADISLPLSNCAECRRVNSIIRDEINAYAAWLPLKNERNKNRIDYKNAMRRWLRTRRALANYKVELEGARPVIQVSPSSSHTFGSGPGSAATHKCVRFDLPSLTDEGTYQKQKQFLRKSRHYKAGKYCTPKGEMWENTSKLK